MRSGCLLSATDRWDVEASIHVGVPRQSGRVQPLTCGLTARGNARGGLGLLHVRVLGVRAARAHGRALTARVGLVCRPSRMVLPFCQHP